MLRELVPLMLAHIKNNEDLLEKNNQLLDIYEGNLIHYVDKILSACLADNYYKTIKDKIVPINILIKVIDKLAKVYSGDVQRISSTDQELVDYYVKDLKLNSRMIKADEYSNLFRAYSLEPFFHNSRIKLRVLPFDRFLPMSISSIDPTEMQVFIKYIGKKMIKRGKDSGHKNVYYAYSDNEFYAFDQDGEPYEDAMKDNEGVNPYGTIPYVYANRVNNKIIPGHNYDCSQMAKLIPVLLTDLVGCIQYQAFSIVYGIDIDIENVRIGPNAIWSLKSDLASQKAPQLGTIKPDADIGEVISFIQSVFTLWLESLNIRVGQSVTLNQGNVMSGISKIIDEMDTIDARKKAIECFETEERQLWEKIKVIHNYHAAEMKMPRFSDNFDLSISFEEPRPFVDTQKFLGEIKSQMDLGLMSRSMAMKEMYPRMSDDQIKQLIMEIDNERGITREVEELESKESST